MSTMSELAVEIITILAGTGITATLFIWLAGKWIGSRIDSSIKHEYDKRKAEYESELRRRERAQLVAELLAEWMSTPPDDAMSPDQRKKLNKLSFEATLWLPEEIASELSQVLQHDPRAPNMFDLLLQVRTHLSGPHQLTIMNVTQWEREKEVPNFGLPTGFKNGRLEMLEVVEENGGLSRAIAEGELQAGYTAPTTATLHFKMPKGKAITKVSTPSIQHLRLIGKRDSAGAPPIYTIEAHPKGIANEINRNLYGATDPQPSREAPASGDNASGA